MACWIYKCNGRQHPYQVAYGDWNEFFSAGKADEWGSTEWVPDLTRLKVGDSILAYQTDRNELVGLAIVRGWRTRKSFLDLILQPKECIGAKVRPLKQADGRIAKIPALQPGPIQTIYEITFGDARRLVAAAGGKASSLDGTTSKVPTKGGGAGFGTPEQNKRVEEAAIRAAVDRLRAEGWTVKNVCTENRGYDLACSKRARVRHVEVKGAQGTGSQFIITANEVRAWKKGIGESIRR